MLLLVTTPLRRKLALTAGLLCLTAPVLSSCGFDYATDRPNVIANGGYDETGAGMRVLGAVIVANQNDQGTFIATLAVNPDKNVDGTSPSSWPSLTALQQGAPAAVQVHDKATVEAGHFTPIAMGGNGMANLGDPSVGGIAVTGDFTAGDVIPVQLTFSDGEDVTVQTPVVTQCGEYASVVPQGTPAGTVPEIAGGDAYSCSYPPAPPIDTAQSGANG